MSAAASFPQTLQIAKGPTRDAGWCEAAEGVAIKVLAVDVERHFAELIFKLAPGYRSGLHRHRCESHALVLEGEVHNLTLDCVYKPGDYYYQPANDEHEEFFPNGAMAYASFRGVDDTLVEFLDDDGQVCGCVTVTELAAELAD